MSLIFIKFDFEDPAPTDTYIKAELFIPFRNLTKVSEAITIEVYNCSESTWERSILIWNKTPSIGPKFGLVCFISSLFPIKERLIILFSLKGYERI